MRITLKSRKRYLNRPLVYVALSFILGIVGGNMFLSRECVSPFFIVALGSIGILCYCKYKNNGLPLVFLGIFLGIILLIIHPTKIESHYFETEDQLKVKGKVYEIQNTPYGQYVIIKNTTICTDKKNIRLRSLVQLNLSTTESITINDDIEIIGVPESIDGPMNPSDFDNKMYLKSKNVIAKVKVHQIINLQTNRPWIEKLQDLLKHQIEVLFQDKDQGIMRALLLGDDTVLESHTDEMYTLSGMSHVLCISGFHISVITGFFLVIMGQLGVGYSLRYLVALIGIWIYAYLTGEGTSTLRATWMMSFCIIGRLIWEEEDSWINLAIVSLILLIFKPYQLFSPGFQLSFLAVLGILIGQILQEHLKQEKRLKRWHKWILPWLPIQLIISLPLAYHFYQVPFLSSFLNFAIIPLFSIIMISGWMCILLGLLGMPMAHLLAEGLNYLLQVISFIIELVLKIPLSTLCVGRPTLIGAIIYILIMIIVLYGIGGYIKKIKNYYYSCVILLVVMIGYKIMPQSLHVAFLYVGQGDGAVIITPKGRVIVIDGGKTGKGDVINRYLRYKGKTHIDIMMLSHSDEDHIGGLIELATTSMPIKQVFISQADESKRLNELIELCYKKAIPIQKLGRGNEILMDDLNLTIIAPNFNVPLSDINDNSLVCYLQYKSFSTLFTGDKSKECEMGVYDEINKVSVLKVSHHGSRTGTSNELLLKVNPLYAMISCGKDNLYGHPHREVVDLLIENHIAYHQTNKSGAIWIETNGDEMKINSQREDGNDEAGMLFTARGR